MELIGIIGAKGCGKSAFSAVLEQDFGFQRLRFADGIKKALKAVGLTDAQVDGGEKNVPLPLLCGKTPRYAMTSLGTGWGRKRIGKDFWVNVTVQEIVARRAASRQGASVRIVVDDVRHFNEAEAILQLGGTLVRLHRPGCGEERRHWWQFWQLWKPWAHESERYWPDLPAQFEVINDRDLSHLREEADFIACAVGATPLKRRRNHART